MLGFNDEAEAQDAYLSNYEKGWSFKHKLVMSSVNLPDFEKWINSSHRKTKPFAEYKSVKVEGTQSEESNALQNQKQKRYRLLQSFVSTKDGKLKKKYADTFKNPVYAVFDSNNPNSEPFYITSSPRDALNAAFNYDIENFDVLYVNATEKKIELGAYSLLAYGQDASYDSDGAFREEIKQRLAEDIGKLGPTRLKESNIKNGNDYFPGSGKMNREQEEAEKSESRSAVSQEMDENGHPFILASDGTSTFGNITEETGLAAAPIKLSEGFQSEDGKGYGLAHIEYRHGEQIRNAGFPSVEKFVEDVAKNFTVIKRGNARGESETYLLEVQDAHNNTLFVELSKDGSYWNVNSAGVFKKGYSKKKDIVWTVPALGSSTNADATEVHHGQSKGETVTSGNSSQTISSEDKGSDSSSNSQTSSGFIARTLDDFKADRESVVQSTVEDLKDEYATANLSKTDEEIRKEAEELVDYNEEADLYMEVWDRLENLTGPEYMDKLETDARKNGEDRLSLATMIEEIERRENRVQEEAEKIQQQSGPVEKIEDIGEKIGGAKKDRFKEFIEREKQLQEKPDSFMEELRKLPVSKIFNFNLEALRKDGLSNEAATLIDVIRRVIPSKPRTDWKLKRWVSDVFGLYRFCLTLATAEQGTFDQILRKATFIRNIGGMYRAQMALGGFDSGLDTGQATLEELGEGAGHYDKDDNWVSIKGQWYVTHAGRYGGIYPDYEKAKEALTQFAGENSKGKEKGTEVKFSIYSYKHSGEAFITPKGKPGIVVESGFKSRKEALDYLNEHMGELQAKYRNMKDATSIGFAPNGERRGKDWRGGKDVTAEDFRNTFGFRGVEFGNWANQQERQLALNQAYDAFMDLSEATGISPQGLSLGGELGMAFGARGGGGAAAHYEPGKVVINLTKTQGAGTLAHEWWHAIDNYFSRRRGQALGYNTERKGYNLPVRGGKVEREHEAERKEITNAFTALMKAINGSSYGERSNAYANLKSSYWKEPTELGARAFAVWVERKLSEKGIVNNFLANNNVIGWESPELTQKYYPYPLESDFESLDVAFDNLFGAIEEKVDEETGNTILYRETDELSQVNARFNEELDAFSIENADKFYFDLGIPSSELLAAGVENRPIRLHGSKVAKKMKKHGFNSYELKNLPMAVAHPIAVFDNLGRKSNRSILTELKTSNGNFLVTIDLGKGTEADFDIVSSVFGKRGDSVIEWINKGYMRYVDKKKALNYLHLSAPIAEALDKSKLSDATKIVENFENPIIEEEILREGVGNLSDAGLSTANDPVSKLLGKSTRTAKQRRAFAERERRNMIKRVQELAEKLHLNNVEIVNEPMAITDRKGKTHYPKGFYNRATDKIVIVIPNNVNTFDAEQTLLHEAVAHYGLRELFGEHFDTFLDNVFNNADMDVRRKIVALAKENGWNTQLATEEYLASLAENTDFENTGASWWNKIKELFLQMLHKIGFEGFDGVTLSDNELRYILWRSYENLREPGRYRSILGQAEDIAKQYELKVGNYAPTISNIGQVAESKDAAKAERIRKLRESKPVEITGEEYKGKYELNRDSAQKYVLDTLRGEYTIKDTGEKVNLSKIGAKKVTSHSMGNEAHLKSIAAIPQLISNAIFIEERPPYKEGAQYDSYRYYVTGLKINGEDYTVRMTIGVKNGKYYYDHYLTNIEKGNLIEIAQGFTPTEDAPTPSYADDKGSDTNSIMQADEIEKGKLLSIVPTIQKAGMEGNSPLSGIKDKRLLSILQDNADENLLFRTGEDKTGDVVKQFKSQVRNTPDIATVRTEGDVDALPYDRLTKEAVRMRLRNKATSGAYDKENNVIFIFPEAARDAAEMEDTLWHETAHYASRGLRLTNGQKNACLEYLRKNYPKKYGEITHWYRQDKWGEEAVAYLFEITRRKYGTERLLNSTFAGNSDIANVFTNIINFLRNGKESNRLQSSDGNGRGQLGDGAPNGTESQGGERMGRVRGMEDDGTRSSGRGTDEGVRSLDERKSDDVSPSPISTPTVEAWDKLANSFKFHLRETAVDHLTAVEIFQELIAKHSGKAIQSYENTYDMMLALSSKNKEEMDRFDSFIVKPMNKAILQLTGEKERIKKWKWDEGPLRELVMYVEAKHGTERNRQMAVEELAKDDKSGDSILKDWNEAKKDINALQLSWEEKQRRLDQAAMNLGADLSQDYSGLSSVFKDKEKYPEGWQEASRKYVSQYEANHNTGHVDDLWKAISNATDYSLRKQYEAGLVSKEYVERQHERFDHYIPLRGFADEVAGDVYNYMGNDFYPGGNPVKTAGGRTSEAGNPFGSILNIAYSSIAVGNKNMAKLALYSLVVNHGTGGLAITNRAWMVKYDELKNNKELGNVLVTPEISGDEETPEWVEAVPKMPEKATAEEITQVMNRFEEVMSKYQQADVTKPVSRKAKTAYRTLYNERSQHEIPLFIAGDKYVITVTGNPRLAQAMNGLLNPDVNNDPFTELGKRVQRFMAGAFTAKNVAFAFANLFKDTMYANNQAFIRENPRYWLKFTANQRLGVADFPLMMRRLYKYREGTLDMNNKTERLFKEFMDNGGATGYTFINSQDEYSKELARKLEDLSKGKAKWFTPKAMGTMLFDLIEFAGQSAELVNRFAAYRTSREMGRSVSRSVREAKEITVNFNRKGAGRKSADKDKSWYSTINIASAISQYGRAHILFWNANMQSKYRFYKNLTEHPVKTGITLVANCMAIGGIAIPFLNNMLLPALYDAMSLSSGDDDEDYYDVLTDWERTHNICVRLPYGNWLKIPLSPEMTPWYSMGDSIFGAASGKRDVSASDFIKSTIDVVSPLSINWSYEGSMLGLNLLPTVTQPVMQIMMNVNFMGNPLHKTPFSTKQGFKPQYEMVYNNASPTLVELSRMSNILTGGSDMKTSGWADWNPANLQNLISGYTGGWGTTILSVADWIVSTSKGEKQAVTFSRMPFVSRFVISGNKDVRLRRINSSFYKVRDFINEFEYDRKSYIDAIRDARKKGDILDMAEHQEKLNRLLNGDRSYKYIRLKEIDDAAKTYEDYLEDMPDDKTTRNLLYGIKMRGIEVLRE